MAFFPETTRRAISRKLRKQGFRIVATQRSKDRRTLTISIESNVSFVRADKILIRKAIKDASSNPERLTIGVGTAKLARTLFRPNRHIMPVKVSVPKGRFVQA
ncbi:hypothetical protein LCGC14_0585160 [marine sediment metagenome]|uniref:Uncharacterized protein n=1 Tax=marine sediment metagenome TaxID=412755 RepID=A0A0F9RK67_9ZZZZ